MFVVLHLYYADPAQLLTSADEELHGLDHDLLHLSVRGVKPSYGSGFGVGIEVGVRVSTRASVSFRVRATFEVTRNRMVPVFLVYEVPLVWF